MRLATAFARGRRVAQAHQGRDERGFTLVELLVAMMIFAIVLALITSATVMMEKSLRKQQGQADNLDASRKVVALLDSQIRYANAITQPGTVGTRTYIEWQSGDTGLAQTCTQWKYDSSAQTLAYRQWTLTPTPTANPTAVVTPSPTATIVSTPGGWVTEAFGVTALAGQPVFATTAAAPVSSPSASPTSTGSPTPSASVTPSGLAYAPDHAQVTVSFGVKHGNPATISATNITLTAVDTIGVSTATGICGQVTRS